MTKQKNCFQRQSWIKYLGQILDFMQNHTSREKFNACFLVILILVLKKTLIWEEVWTLNYNPRQF